MLNYCANGPAGYNLTNSLRFRSSASAYLKRVPASAGSRTTWTWSSWIKRGALADCDLFGTYTGNTDTDFLDINIVNNTLRIGAWFTGFLATTQVLRDPSAWYHIVVAVDTTQATASNRIKMYINGVQVTSFGTANYPAQNATLAVNQAGNTYIGYVGGGGWGYFDGYMAEQYFIDGQALTPSSFGSTNATTGVWQPAKYTGTYGTNGFYLPFNKADSASGFSNYYGGFNGSNQYLTTPNGSQYAFGTGDFTIESWVYLDGSSAYATIATTSQAGSGSGGVWILEFSQTRGLFFNNYGAIGFYPQYNQWYHVAISRQSGTLRAFINGILFLSATDSTNYSATTGDLGIGGYPAYAGYFMYGKMSNFRIVKGTAVYTSTFTPPTTLTAVSGTSLLTLQNSTIIDNSGSSRTITNYNSVTMTSATIGNYNTVTNDYSGNNNNWVNNYVNVVTSGTTYDWMTDVPTLTSATVANYAVLNPLPGPQAANIGLITNANLSIANNAGATNMFGFGSISMDSGKFYWEVTITGMPNANTSTMAIGICGQPYADATMRGYYNNGNYWNGSASISYGATYTTNDIIGVAFDATNQTIEFFKNGTSQGQKTSIGTSGTNEFAWILSTSTPGAASFNFGQRPFSYSVPSGFVALNTYNLPTSTIVQGNKYMDATAYTGTNGSPTTQVISSNFQPDFLWFKKRSAAYDHALIDTNRGITKQLYSNLTNAEGTDSDVLTAIGASSFTVGNSNYSNYGTLVAWTWKANGGTTSSNTQGSITSTVQANTSAGFSIVTYTGAGTSAGTVGHGLGVAPKLIIAKTRTSAQTWVVYHETLGINKLLELNTTGAASTISNYWGSSAPTSTVFGVYTGNNIGNNNYLNIPIVAYCWAEIAGFSKFGSYTGNGSADGPFVYTGFRPKFVMIKSSAGIADDWSIIDTSRSTYNLCAATLKPNTSAAEDTNVGTTRANIDILSNGFKIRQPSDIININTGTYIYAAFSENPFKNSLAR